MPKINEITSLATKKYVIKVIWFIEFPNTVILGYLVLAGVAIDYSIDSVPTLPAVVASSLLVSIFHILVNTSSTLPPD